MNYKIYQLIEASYSLIYESEFSDDAAALAYVAGLDPSQVYQIEAQEATYTRIVNPESPISPSLTEIEARCEALNAARDTLTGYSPLYVEGLGTFDFAPKDQTKLDGTKDYLIATDTLDPENAPHSVPWTMYDNSEITLTRISFFKIDIAKAVRGLNLHQACKRAKAAIRAGQEPDPADLAILTL